MPRVRALVAALLMVSSAVATARAGGQGNKLAARRLASQRADRPPPVHLASDAPPALAAAIRTRADEVARTIRTGRRPERRAAMREFRGDLDVVLGALERIQTDASVDPITEHRALAAVGRVLHAIEQAEPDEAYQPTDVQVDRFRRASSRATYRRKVAHHETAVEIESRMTDEILDALTTEDGTLRPLLEEGGMRPPGFLAAMAGAGGIHAIPWDRLDRDEKLAVLRSQSRGRGFARRRIPGMRFRRQIAKPVFPTLTLAGKPAGVRATTLPVDGVLMEHVEYRSPRHVDQVSGVEMHIRHPGRASGTARDAFTVSGVLGSPSTRGHQHLPGRLPAALRPRRGARGGGSSRTGDPVARAEFVDFYRRANLVGELITVERGLTLRPDRVGRDVHFDYLQGGQLSLLDEHLAAVAAGAGGTLRHDSLKMAAVGFRTGVLYGGDATRFGLEVRVLFKTGGPQGERYLDALQKAVITGSYGLPRHAIRAWRDRVLGGAPTTRQQGEALARLHYNRPVQDLVDDAPGYLRADLTPPARQRIEAESFKNYGLKMLVHDWTSDPVLVGDPPAVARVQAAQRAGLRALAGGGEATPIVRQFVADSGLTERFAASIGMDDPTVQ